VWLASLPRANHSHMNQVARFFLGVACAKSVQHRLQLGREFLCVCAAKPNLQPQLDGCCPRCRYFHELHTGAVSIMREAQTEQ
jgi:hypothetical protein